MVADTASTSVSGAPVLHDDTAALNAAVSTNAVSGAEINLPCGTYNLTSTVRITVAKIGFNGHGMCSIINGYGVDDDFQWIGTSPSKYLFGGSLQNIYQPSYNKIGGNALTVRYFQNYTYNNVFVDHPWRGAEFFDVNDVRASHDRFVSVWGYRGWTFRMASGSAAAEYACCFDLRDVYANNLATASPGGGRTGSYGFWIDGNVATVISYNSAISNVEGTALEISNTVHNPAGPQFLQFTDWGAEFSNGRAISIDAGQEVYFIDPVLHSSRNGNDNVFVDASAKVISFQGGRNGAAGCNDYTINGSDITIANQAIYNASTPSAGGTTSVCQGIVLGSTASNAVILGNRIGQEYGVNWRQKYPVLAASGATNFSITGNVFKGNVFDYVDMAAGYSSTQVEAGNSGNPPPTLASGFGTGAAIIANNGFRSFRVKVGTDGTASSGVVGLPLAVGGWACSGSDLTTHSATVAQTASTPSSATLGNFNTAGASAPWSDGDVLNACSPAALKAMWPPPHWFGSRPNLKPRAKPLEPQTLDPKGSAFGEEFQGSSAPLTFYPSLSTHASLDPNRIHGKRLDAGPFDLEQHANPAVAVAPAPVQRLIQFGECHEATCASARSTSAAKLGTLASDTSLYSNRRAKSGGSYCPVRNFPPIRSNRRARPPAPCRIAAHSARGSMPAFTPMVNASASATLTAAPDRLCTSLATEPAPIGPM